VTTLAIILGSTLAAAVAGLIALGVWLRAASASLDATRAVLLGEQRRGDRLQGERDQLTVRAAELWTETHELQRRLAAAERQRNDAIEREAQHVGESIRDAGSGPDALARLSDELQRPLLPATGAPGPATAGGDRSAEGAVQPAGPAESAAPPRSP
jgi:hypothetical protein